jgi:hypothetical protein
MGARVLINGTRYYILIEPIWGATWSLTLNDCKLPYQLPVPWQLEPKPGNDLLGHEVVPHIPTELPVESFGHDIVNPKVHAALNPKERCCVLLPPLPLAAKYAAPRALDALRACVVLLGGLGDRTPRKKHARTTLEGRIICSCFHDLVCPVAIARGIFLQADFSPIKQPAPPTQDFEKNMLGLAFGL